MPKAAVARGMDDNKLTYNTEANAERGRVQASSSESGRTGLVIARSTVVHEELADRPSGRIVPSSCRPTWTFKTADEASDAAQVCRHTGIVSQARLCSSRTRLTLRVQRKRSGWTSLTWRRRCLIEMLAVSQPCRNYLPRQWVGQRGASSKPGLTYKGALAVANDVGWMSFPVSFDAASDRDIRAALCIGECQSLRLCS